MAEAIIDGLIAKEICRGGDIFVTNRGNREKLAGLEKKHGVKPSYNMEELAKNADIMVLAVKPKDAGEAIEKLRAYIQPGTLLVSVMAGISIAFMEEKLQTEGAVARAMPNTSASIGMSATALSFNQTVSARQKDLAGTVFSAIGITAVVEEEELDAITALSGSGPAYIYFIAESMEAAAEKLGLNAELGRLLILQTMAGASEMLRTSGKEAADLRKAVTSPGGTTAAGIAVLEKKQVDEAVIECIQAASEQSKQMRKTFESGE